jgi:acylglycerol lipase
MKTTAGRFAASDGFGLFERSWMADDGETRAVVALLHGGGEHSGRYEHTAAVLTATGFVVEAFDQRSHGHSDRVHGVPLQVERFADLIDDTEAWLTHVRRRHDGLPVFVLAHSMGGLIAVTLAAQGRLLANGLITTGAALYVLPPRLLEAAVERARTEPDAIVAPMRRDGFDVSTRDPAMKAAIADDPTHADVPGVPAQFLAEVARHTAIVRAQLAGVTVPLLALHGTDDKMADVAGSEELVAQAASTDKTLVLMPDGYHALLRDLCRRDVEQLIVSWLVERLPPG